MLSIIMLMSLIFGSNIECNTSINGNFLECEVNSLHSQLLLNKNCFEDDFKSNTIIDVGFYYNATVIYKKPYVYKDFGTECKIKTTAIIYHTDLTFNHYTEGPFVEYLKLSKEDCFNLKTNKLCNQIPMECKSNKTCHYIQPRQDAFPIWIGKNSVIYYECQFNERLVTTVEKFDSGPVFHDAIGPCDINSGVCFLPLSTVIWNGDRVTYCALEKIILLYNYKSVELGNGTYGIGGTQAGDYLFQLVDNVQECGVRMKSTTSGLYIAFHKDNINNDNLFGLKQSNWNMDQLQEQYVGNLIYAERDEKFLLFKKEINKIGCSLMLNSIQTQLHKHDTFFKINFLSIKIFIYFYYKFIFIKN
jgi:hypothetical protein